MSQNSECRLNSNITRPLSYDARDVLSVFNSEFIFTANSMSNAPILVPIKLPIQNIKMLSLIWCCTGLIWMKSPWRPPNEVKECEQSQVSSCLVGCRTQRSAVASVLDSSLVAFVLLATLRKHVTLPLWEAVGSLVAMRIQWMTP